MVAIIDYGVGNLFSLRSSFAAIGEQAEVTGDAARIAQADRVILPGVGAFADAYDKLCESGMDEAVRRAVKSGKPVMGICLGMQLLFERSYEYGEHPGLGLLEGEVVGMEGRLPGGLAIPHIGWNALRIKRPGGVLKYVEEGDCVYFVHSYYAENCAVSLTATAEYGLELTAAVQRENLYGCQFHPEKSGKVGLGILRAFCELEG
uniref:imidazole glycerol phosphate synthase subunit HisH n=1 Tax=Candidatus Scatomorpha intestinigallinarum TaxID=2840923 RepID=UPI004028BC3E